MLLEAKKMFPELTVAQLTGADKVSIQLLKFQGLPLLFFVFCCFTASYTPCARSPFCANDTTIPYLAIFFKLSCIWRAFSALKISVFRLFRVVAGAAVGDDGGSHRPDRQDLVAGRQNETMQH